MRGTKWVENHRQPFALPNLTMKFLLTCCTPLAAARLCTNAPWWARLVRRVEKFDYP